MAKKKRKHFSRERIPTRPCPVTHAGVEEVNYKDIELLRMFITEKGKIIPKRISGLSARAQKKITRAIKQARNAALLSFSEGYISQDEVQD
jgi:small subunit ribosomal protein S18